MQKILLAVYLFACLTVAQQVSAYTPGSTTTYSGLGIGGCTVSDVSETLYIGPGNYIINGSWNIYAKQVVIDPLAIINGTGSINFYNPSVAGGAAATTLIDGNNSGNNIDVNMTLNNASGMALTELPFSVAFTSAGFTNNAAATTLYVGKDLSLAVDEADVTLGTGVVGNLKFDADATISNYRPERMVIMNNSILSHMVKENYTTEFTFPVGIADGDYTPAKISNVSVVTVHVGVQDYVASTATEETADPGFGGLGADGMKRTWHIFGDAEGTGTTIILQHNSSTNQSAFNDASHFITRWGSTVPNATGDMTVSFSGSPWQTNTPAAGATGALSSSGWVAGSSVNSRTYAVLATSGTLEESYFTKSSDIFHPLSVDLISYTAQSKNCDVALLWTAGVESQLASYRVKHSTDRGIFNTIATFVAKGSNSQYSFLHTQAAKGFNLYQLEMVEKDGSYKLSGTEQVKTNCEIDTTSILVYPNPTQNVLSIRGMGAGLLSQIRIMNIHGQVIMERNGTNDKETFNISELPTANYLLQVLQNGEIKLTTKVISNKIALL